MADEELRLTRDLSFDETQILAKEREQETLRAALAQDLAALVLRRLAALIRDLTARVVDTTTLTVPERVRAEIVRQARAAGVKGNRATIKGLPTHADLASRLGATREAVSRASASDSHVSITRTAEAASSTWMHAPAPTASRVACAKLNVCGPIATGVPTAQASIRFWPPSGSRLPPMKATSAAA